MSKTYTTPNLPRFRWFRVPAAGITKVSYSCSTKPCYATIKDRFQQCTVAEDPAAYIALCYVECSISADAASLVELCLMYYLAGCRIENEETQKDLTATMSMGDHIGATMGTYPCISYCL